MEVKLDEIAAVGDEGTAAVLMAAQESDYEMSAEQVNTMVAAYEKQGGDADAFVRGFEEAFRAGYSGTAMPTSGIAEGIAEIAYQQGKTEAVNDDKTRIAAAAKKTGDAMVGWLGQVTDGSQVKGSGDASALDNAMKGMTKGQKFMVEFARELSQKTGINFALYESKANDDGNITTQNGSYDASTRTVYLDINAGANTEADVKTGRRYGTLGDAMMRTMAHEVTHAIESAAPEVYNRYKAAVKAELETKGQDWTGLVNGKIRRAAETGHRITLKAAEAEVVADASEYMLQDSKFVKGLTQDTQSRIMKVIKDFVAKVNAVFKRLAGSGYIESSVLREMQNGMRHYSKTLQELWDTGFDVLAGEAVAETEAAEDGYEAVMEMPELNPRAADEADVSPEHPVSNQFSIRQLAESLSLDVQMVEGSDQPYAIMDKDGNIVKSFTPEQVETTPLGGLIDAAMAVGTVDKDAKQSMLKMISEVATIAANYEDQAMVWEIAGSQLFSAIKNNSDKQYSRTVDFGTVCSKTQAIIDVLSETMLKLDRGLTRKEVIAAYNATAKNDQSVPCPPCYVFSRWMGVPNLLNNMARYQERFGKMSAEQVTEYLDRVQNKYAVPGERFSKTIGVKKTELDNKINKLADDMRIAHTMGKDMSDLFEEDARLRDEYEDVEAYNWVTQVLCESGKVDKVLEVVRDKNGTVVLDKSYKPVPHDVLFDMRKTGEFAKYPKSWKYRSTRGAGMGKSILPYSGASLGDTVYGQQKRTEYGKNVFLNQRKTNAQRQRAIRNAVRRMKSQNLIGGHRFQSTSDYRPEWGLDYLMTLLEMQAIGAKGQLYTKVIEAVDLFATAGIEVNLSIMAKGDGWHRDENGNPVMGIEDFSSISGIDYTLAKEKTELYDNVQMILVGMNDDHIRLALADDAISFVIPWHSSGNNAETLKKLFDAVGEDLKTSQDYTDVQSDKPVPKATELQKLNARIRKKILTAGYAKTVPTAEEMAAIEANEFLHDLYIRFCVDKSATDTYGVKLTADQASQVFPYEYWDTSLSLKDADENGRRFVRYCESIGLIPRFSDFADDAGYWKLLIDRRMYNRDGTYHEPRTIDVTKVSISDVAGSVSAAKYGDPVKTGNAVMQTIEDLRAMAASEMYPEGSIIESTDKYGDTVEIETDTLQHSLRDQTDTPAFKRWFSGSKVVNADGSPKVMYHGTNADDEFTVFNTYGSRFGLFGTGSYFTDNPDVAQSYTRKGRGHNPRVYQVYLSIKNPLDMDASYDPGIWLTDDEEYNAYFDGAETNEDAFRALEQYCQDEMMYAWEANEYIIDTIEGAGFDGITHIGGGRVNKNDPTRHRVYIAFEPNQIKSATDNVGTFDPRDPDIRYSERDLPAEVSVREYLANSDDSVADTVEERNALKTYRERLKEHADATDAVIAAEEALKKATSENRESLESDLRVARVRQQKLYRRLIAVENTPHVQAVTERTAKFISDSIKGKSRYEIAQMIERREQRLAKLEADLKGLKGAAKNQRAADVRAVRREIAQLRNKAAEHVATLNERHAERVNQIKARHAEEIQRKNEQIGGIRARHDMNASIESRANHIRSVVKKLNNRLTKEEDYKNVKEPLKPAVRKVVRTFIDGFGSLVFNEDASRKLKSVYDLMAAAGSEVDHLYDADVAAWLDELAELAEADEARREGDTYHLASVEEKLYTYTKVAEIADHIYKMVTDADQLFIAGKKAAITEVVAEIGGSLVAKKDKTLLVGAARKAVGVLDDMIRTGNLTPQYFFDSLKNSGLSKLYDGLMDGQRKYAKAILDGKRFVEQAKKDYNYYKWGHSRKPMNFTTHEGHKIGLTIEQALWVYATAKREATNTLAATRHLEVGGFRYDSDNLPRSKWYKAMEGSNIHHRLDATDVEAISNMLTPEQRGYADALVRYLSEDCAALGNRASMQLFGIKKYNESYYFPFKVDSDQLHQRSDAGSTSTTNDARVKHSSFTHALRRGASQPLVMGNFSDVIGDHINQMATYASFVTPIESLNRVMNHKINESPDGTGSNVSIRSLIGRKYGESAQKYVADLLKDLNGGPQVDTRGTGLISSLFRAFKRGAVLGSMSVALQQPTAIVRAFAFVNPRYFTARGNGLGRDAWNRILTYSGTAVIKDMGKFDVGLGKMADDWIMNSDSGLKIRERARFLMDAKGLGAVRDNFVEFATALPGFFDRITWTQIWNAVEAEQADQHPGMDRNSEAFLRIVGKRFDDVISHTQVYDSILAKSQNMRSKNALAQMSTAFMSEPTLGMNLYYDAFTGNHSRGKRAGMVASVIVSNLLAAAMAAAVAAWNRDDDERTVAEKYAGSFAERAVDNLNPFGMLPYVADLWNLASGYDVERTDWAVFKDIIDAGNAIYDKIQNEETITWKNVEDFAGQIANLTGIPARNWSRDIRRLYNLIFRTDFSAPEYGVGYTLMDTVLPDWAYGTSTKDYSNRLVTAVLDGDTQEAVDLWDYLTKSMKASQASLEKNIREVLKERVQAGTMTTAQATQILRKYVPYKDDKNNTKKPQEWLEAKDE